MGKPIMAVFIVLFNGAPRGGVTGARPRVPGSLESLGRPVSPRRSTSVVRVLTTTRCANTGTASRLTSSGIAYERPSARGQRTHRAVQRLSAAGAHPQRQRFVRAGLFHNGEHIVHKGLRWSLRLPQSLAIGGCPQRLRTGLESVRRPGPSDWRRISRSLSGGSGNPTLRRIRKRSSCDSGSG